MFTIILLFLSASSYASPLEDWTSTQKLEISRARVLIDNDQSFKSKIEAIREAKDSIEIVYYIYQNDFTSSLMSQELIAAAKRGVKVRILLDYFTNLTRHDLFKMMKKQGQGNIEISFYGKPTDNVVEDAIYLTIPCPKDAPKNCENEKRKKSQQILKSFKKGESLPFFTRLFLSGLYTQNFSVLKKAVIKGQGLTLFDSSESEKKKDEGLSLTKETIDGLKTGLKLLYGARIKDNLLDKIKLNLGLLFLGDKIKNYYKLLSSSIPLVQGERNRLRDWRYFTDFTHHKMLLVDNNIFQIGGRNIEDSYHMKKNPLVDPKEKKYTFIDTDFAADVSSKSGQEIQKTFNRLWNFTPLVMDYDKAMKLSPYSLIAQKEKVFSLIDECEASVKGRINVGKCVEQSLEDDEKSRLQESLKNMRQNANTYKNEYAVESPTQSWKGENQNGKFSQNDLENMTVRYIENLPLQKNAPSKRQFGADVRHPSKSSKYIHAYWKNRLEHVCRKESGSKEIILHNAYFFPPSHLVNAFGKMVNGTWPCKGVKVTILTNSVHTTDLFPINFLASAQLKALFNYIRENENKENAAEFEYVVYQKRNGDENRSLHGKVMVFGDEIYIGSANMDLRSYTMDSNNGVVIQGANEFIEDYKRFIADIVANKNDTYPTTNRTDDLKNAIPFKSFAEKKFNEVKGRLGKDLLEKIGSNPAIANEVKGIVMDLLGFIYQTSNASVSYENIPTEAIRRPMDRREIRRPMYYRSQSWSDSTKRKKLEQQEKLEKRLDALFSVM